MDLSYFDDMLKHFKRTIICSIVLIVILIIIFLLILLVVHKDTWILIEQNEKIIF